MRRLVLLVALLVIGMALPAAAKMLPFDLEVKIRGETVLVEVIVNGDASLIDEFDPPDLNTLLAVFPLDQVDKAGRPLYVLEEGTYIPLSRVEPGIYRGGVTLSPGRWAVVPFPDLYGDVRGIAEGRYPNTVLVEMKEETSALWGLALMGVVMIIGTAWTCSTRAGRKCCTIGTRDERWIRRQAGHPTEKSPPARKEVGTSGPHLVRTMVRNDHRD